jgi:hypothetical protein
MHSSNDMNAMTIWSGLDLAIGKPFAIAGK